MPTRPVDHPERIVTPEDVERAEQLIAGEVRETPVLPAGELSRRVGGSVLMKTECLQLTGSFKVRGAFNKMSGLSDAELEAGMVAASAGNHAQAVALAADRRGSHADLFMPAEAPLAKVSAVRGYGGGGGPGARPPWGGGRGGPRRPRPGGGGAGA